MIRCMGYLCSVRELVYRNVDDRDDGTIADLRPQSWIDADDHHGLFHHVVVQTVVSVMERLEGVLIEGRPLLILLEELVHDLSRVVVLVHHPLEALHGILVEVGWDLGEMEADASGGFHLALIAKLELELVLLGGDGDPEVYGEIHGREDAGILGSQRHV